MKYEEIKHISCKEFTRLVGIKINLFDKMTEYLKEQELLLRKKGGKPSRISTTDKLFMTLIYFKEYRTFLSISKDYGVCEASVFKIIKWVENTLIKHPDLRLPGKKSLMSNDHCNENEEILIDLAEINT